MTQPESLEEAIAERTQRRSERHIAERRRIEAARRDRVKTKPSSVVDNLGTRDHPTPRFRVKTPLTPRRVRLALIEPPDWLRRDEDADDGTMPVSQWLGERQTELPRLLTELDLMLDDDEAWALERFVANEELLAGNARCPDWTREAVQTSQAQSAPLSDAELDALQGHTEFKRTLSEGVRAVLLVFLIQQQVWDGAPSAAQAAFMLGLQGRRRARAWWLAVADAAKTLVERGY